MKTLTKRLREIIGEESVHSFAIRCNIGDPLLRKYLAGSQPGLDKAVAIARTANVRLEWLATGEGPKTPYDSETGIFPKGALVRLKSPDYVFIPLYDVRAAAGSGMAIETEEIIDLLVINRTWVRQQLGTDPANLCFLYIEGDSMEPMLRPGEVVLVDRAAAVVPVDGIYVIRFDGHLMVKRVQREGKNILTLSSVNPDYKPITVTPGDGRDLAVIGRVVWHGRNI